jgi:hypothetical protein
MPWKPIYTATEQEISEFKKQYSGRARILVDENAGQLEHGFGRAFAFVLGHPALCGYLAVRMPRGL